MKNAGNAESDGKRPLSYALIGAGSAGCAHLKAICSRENVRLVGIVDPAPESDWKLGSAGRNAPHFASIEMLLNEVRPDIASICTPPRDHAKTAMAALRAGAHVACEKPMAMNMLEARQMEQVRAEAGRVGLVNFSYRNLAALRFARLLIRDGALGRVTRIHASYLQSHLRAAGGQWTWRNDAATAGFGAMGDLGVHLIDAVRFVAGLEFRRVTGLKRTWIKERIDAHGRLAEEKGARRPVTTDTDAVFLAEMENDATTVVEASQTARGYGNLFSLEVGGELATVRVTNEAPDRVELSERGERGAGWKAKLKSSRIPGRFPGKDWPASPSAIVDAVRGGATGNLVRIDYPSFADGLAAQRVLEALGHAIETEGWAGCIEQASDVAVARQPEQTSSAEGRR